MEDPTPDTAGSARLFIALWPDAGVRDALADWSGQWQWNAAAKRVPAERLHLTLHFLGDVPRARMPALRVALRLPFAPFSVSLGRPALWPGGIAVLEPDRVPTRLRQLHAALGEALQRLTLPAEQRIYRPHVTLARRAGSALPPLRGPRLRWPVRGYALVESRPQPAADYEVLQAYP
jgi:RNA 2',3'-cyclic 3'-phosphodiesterase